MMIGSGDNVTNKDDVSNTSEPPGHVQKFLDVIEKAKECLEKNKIVLQREYVEGIYKQNFEPELHVLENINGEVSRLSGDIGKKKFHEGVGGEIGKHNTIEEFQHDSTEIPINIEDDFDGIREIEEENVNDYNLDDGDDMLEEHDRDDGANNGFGEVDGRSEEDDSEDVSYMVENSSSDTDESVFNDFEMSQVVQEYGSDYEDEDSVPENGVSAPRQPTALDEPEGSASNPFFFVGMTYVNKSELRKTLTRYAVNMGVNLKTCKSDKHSLRMRCQEGCPFHLFANTCGVAAGFQVKTLVYEHCCPRAFDNRNASTMWLSDLFKDKVQGEPKFQTSEMMKEVKESLKVNVSIDKCKRAKRKITQEMEGSYNDEFCKLEAYCNHLRESNPGSDVNVEISEEALKLGRRVFKRMYICFHASKVGWRAGCRPFFGVDGTHLLGKTKGILLTALGLDANESFYPLAFALVQKENTVNWSWFLQWVRNSLNLESGAGVTLISDMQKGLCRAANDVLPDIEHRFCARHIYQNWSKAWRGGLLKVKFWACAWSTFDEEFQDNLRLLDETKPGAARAAMTYNPQSWVRAYFPGSSKCWNVDNNACESFNSWIKSERFLPVISMLEGIRTKMMKKWAGSEKKVEKWKSDYSPKCLDLFEANRCVANACWVEYNGADGYEVREGRDTHTVFLSNDVCSCRAWDLTGILCQHAVCAMYHAQVDPKTKISHYYHKDTYLASYREKFQPVSGGILLNTTGFSPMQPPPVETLPGRPVEKRIRTEEGERRMKRVVPLYNETRPPVPEQIGVERLTRKEKVYKCSACNQEGHNKRK